MAKTSLKYFQQAVAVTAPDATTIAGAKAFLLRKWQERAAEGGQKELPTDLTNACKFASAFAQQLFGGDIRGNAWHQFNRLPDGTILDLTDGAGDTDNLRYHDRRFWQNREHVAAMESIEPRVDRWVAEFLRGQAQ